MKKDKVLNVIKFRNDVSLLPKQYREMVLIYFLEELNQKEIADKLNLSYGVLRNRLSKGIYLLKKVIQEENNTAELFS